MKSGSSARAREASESAQDEPSVAPTITTSPDDPAGADPAKVRQALMGGIFNALLALKFLPHDKLTLPRIAGLAIGTGRFVAGDEFSVHEPPR